MARHKLTFPVRDAVRRDRIPTTTEDLDLELFFERLETDEEHDAPERHRDERDDDDGPAWHRPHRRHRRRGRRHGR